MAARTGRVGPPARRTTLEWHAARPRGILSA